MHGRGGFCAWFTGLPCSGKTTVARALTTALEARGTTVTLLDGDAVRPILSAGLQFSREDRHINLMRIAFVAKEVVRHGGAAICATVSPYRADRDAIRASFGGLKFFEIYVNTPLSVCEARDVKGMYARARRGEILHFTGVDDPYEPPQCPDIVCETLDSSPEDCVRTIWRHLETQEVRLSADQFAPASLK
ncbi:MAG TPA: adenylyl-sulfate kinase [Bryobacteraceae bacterium]